MFPAVGVALGSLQPITEGVLWRWLKFQACTNILNNFFNNSRNFWVLPNTFYSFVNAVGEKYLIKIVLYVLLFIFLAYQFYYLRPQYVIPFTIQYNSVWLLCATSILAFFSAAAQQNFSAVLRAAHMLIFVSTLNCMILPLLRNASIIFAWCSNTLLI